MRLFFAIWPDDAVKERLDELARRLHRACGGRRLMRESIHITLIFLGEVDHVEDLLEAASSVSGRAFEIRIDKTVYWKHNRIAWAGTSSVPENLGMLVDELKKALKREGLSYDERGDYVPHVTLVRKAMMPADMPEFEPFSWSVSEFCLVESADSGYRIIGKWPLEIDAAGEMPG